MIRIEKGEAPAVLLGDGVTRACEHCDTFDNDAPYFLGGKPVPVSSDLYGLHAEQPLLVKPDRDDPAVHIRWEEDHPFALTPEGEVTIRVVGLIRELDPSRGEVLTKVRAAVSRIKKYGEDGSPSVQELLEPDREHLRAAVLKSAPHSAMVRAYLLALGFVPDPGPPAAA